MAAPRLFDQVGRVVDGRYRLTAPLGAGTSAQVYLATDVKLDREVACKILHPDVAGDDRFARRFHTEVRTVSNLSHPNIVAVFDWGEDETPFLVTEYLGGGSLRDLLDDGRTLSPAQALVVGLEAADGLAAAHAAGIVHRDIKPANLLFGADGRLRIADFGLARAVAEASRTELDGTLLGTARYASPEQALGETVDARGDLYSLALVLVEAVTGAVPFQSDTTISTLMARTERDLDAPAALGPLAGVIEWAGRVDRDERPAAAEFRSSLLRVAEELDAPDPIPLIDPLDRAPVVHDDGAATSVAPQLPDEPPPDAGERRNRRWPWVAAATVFAAVVAAIAVFASDQLGTETFEVPVLVGRQIESAEVVADQNGWEIRRRQNRRDGTQPGEILSTDPAAGERLAVGDVLEVTVSAGNELTDLPDDLVGAPVAEAVAALESARLEPSITRRNDEEVPTDVVIALGDVPVQVARGDVVELIVSDGPARREVPPFDPEDGYDVVAAAIEAVQLVPEKVEEFSDDVPKGHVIGLSPSSGVLVERDSTVQVRVSKGPETVKVPDIRGKKLDEAKRILESVGLRLGQQCCRADGTVVESDPPAGAVVELGTEVDVFLRR